MDHPHNTVQYYLWSMIMDIEISLTSLSHEMFEDYVHQIQNSNLSKFTQNGLIDLLKTVALQTIQAKKMGWLR
jgi:hypothetical protein